MRIWVLCPMLVSLVQGGPPLQETHAWRQMDFLFPSTSERNNAINSGRFIMGNSLPLDVDVYAKDGRRFITTPSVKPGTPATLSVLSQNTYAPLLQPYPNWSWHRQGDCSGLTSVWRIQIDECGRLWALDSGVVDSMTTARRVCPPKLVVFNLATNQKILEHRFPASVLKESSLLVTVVVDVPPGTCANTFAYVADVTRYGLIVFDMTTTSSWRVESNFFYPDPRWGHFNVAGGEFDLMDGILGMALSPRLTNGDRRLYWHSLASDSEGYVLASVLQDRNAFQDGFNSRAGEFFLFDGRRSSQAAAEAMSSDAIMFFSQLSNNSLNCWNAWYPYGPSSTKELLRDNERLQFVTGLKVIRNSYNQEEVWLVSNRFQRAAQGTINQNDVNYRVMTGLVKNLIYGTVCDVKM